MTRQELLNKLKDLGDLNLYLKLKDKSDEVIKLYIQPTKTKTKSKTKNEGTFDRTDDIVED